MENWSRAEGLAFVFGFLAPYFLLVGGFRGIFIRSEKKPKAGNRSLCVGIFFLLFWLIFQRPGGY